MRRVPGTGAVAVPNRNSRMPRSISFSFASRDAHGMEFPFRFGGTLGSRLKARMRRVA
jgi:hypothetical protein